MPRLELDRKLAELREQVLLMGQDVEAAISASMAALTRNDTTAAAAVIAGDDTIDCRCARIGDMGAHLITLQQPAIRDLRVVLASLAISEDLERIGDHAEGIAQLVCRLPTPPDGQTMLALNGIAALARVQLKGALDAYRTGDATRARTVWASDQDVDRLHGRLVQSLIASMGKDPAELATDTYLLWLAHNLERIADRAGNICERVVFIATGERRLAMAPVAAAS